MTQFFSKSRKAMLFGIVAGLSAIALPAKANLSITPTLLLIEGRERYADVHLVNPTSVTNNYEIGWRFFKMEEGTGNYISSDKSTTDWDLTKHIVFTPKRMSIDPQVAQKVRLGLRLGGEPPPPGDYRAHLEFMKVGERDRRLNNKPEENTPAADRSRASVSVDVNVGFSIPVIYRVGESDATAKIGAVKTAVNPQTGKIQGTVTIEKSKSPFGIMGHLLVYYGDDMIGQVQNANIFPEIGSRTFTFNMEAQKLSGGSLKVVFKDASRKKDVTYDQKIIPVAQ